MSDFKREPFNAKRCGACVYWQGERTICANEVTYNENSVGKCNNPNSPAYGRGVQVILNCFSKKDID